MLYFNWLQEYFKNSRRSETVDCSPTSGSELFHALERCAVRHSCQAHQSWICGYVHVYKIVKQLFHACSGNSQNYCPEVLEMTWELLPEAEPWTGMN
jgi:hypothetical protein